MYGHVITKFSWMGSLPHFVTHGAPLRCESFISRKDAGIGGGAHKERASYGTMFKAIALKAF